MFRIMPRFIDISSYIERLLEAEMGSFTKSNCLLLIVGAALIALPVYAQQGSGNGSGCGDCGAGDYCAPECECTVEGFAQTLEGICQKVCDSSYNWCGTGTECIEDSQYGYECECAADLFENADGSCQTGLFFGGEIFYTTDTTAPTIRSTDATVPTNKDVVSLLNEIFKDSTGYVGATVFGEITATNAAYELTYLNIDGVDEYLVKSSYEDATGSCSNTVYSGSLYLNCTETRVVVENALCDDGGRFENYCGSNSECDSTPKGLYYCNCKTGFASPYEGATSCVAIKCEVSDDCSGSFQGECIKPSASSADNYCKCSWGFSGDKCDNPWWFVFTVLTGVFGALAIGILVGCLVCSNKKTEKVVKDSEKDDLDLKNPFVDFQPGIVRAKASSNVYNTISDSLTTPSTQGHNNPAYSSTTDDGMEKSGGYAAAGNDYF